VAESHCAVITTTDSAEAAEELGRGIVEARLGACVQIVGPIRSLYRWEGGVQNDQEWQCWVKTSTDRSMRLLSTSRRITVMMCLKWWRCRLLAVVRIICRGLLRRLVLVERRGVLSAKC
jgi:uncharacterized protein involved in tolerance to divalent cations